MPRLKKILAPVDYSDCSRGAMDTPCSWRSASKPRSRFSTSPRFRWGRRSTRS